jgi:phosphoglycerol transferase
MTNQQAATATSAAQAVVSDPRVRTLTTAGIYCGTALLSLVIVFWVMQLWRSDLSIPLHSQDGDGTFYDTVVKNLIENGTYNRNPFIGAPGQGQIYDFPLPHGIHFALLRLLSIFAGQFGTVINLYFLLTFPLTAVVSMFVLRRFGISNPLAIVTSVLYAILPYHFMRGEHHLIYASYYLVPLALLLPLWLCTGERLFRFVGQDGKRGFGLTRQGAIALAACVLLGIDNAYSALFTAFFIVLGGFVGRLRYQHRHAPVVSVILLATLLITFTVQLSPNFMYWLRQDSNPEVATRVPAESERYGLKVAQLLLPVTGHRISAWADLKAKYNREAPLVFENDSASLGLIGSVGFLALLGGLLFGGSARNRPLFEALCVLNISAVAVATIGGFSSLYAFLISPQLRAYNRMSIMIAFLSLFAIALLLDGWLLRRKRILSVVAVGLLVLGLFDQTTAALVPDYASLKAEYINDQDFVQRIESALPREAMVFQLPYMSFPEHGSLVRMADYDQFRGYLHSHHLRWSYGAMKGRESDAWLGSISQRSPAELVDPLIFAGFGGIYVDRFGYSDHAAQLESELAKRAGVPLVSANGRLAFFDLTRTTADLREKYTPQQWQSKRESGWHPVVVQWGRGCFAQEGTAERSWRWCGASAYAYVSNLSSSPVTVDLDIAAATGDRQPAHLSVQSPWFSKTAEVSPSGATISARATIPPGKHRLWLTSDARRVDASLDPRILIVRIDRFRITEADISSPTNEAEPSTISTAAPSPPAGDSQPQPSVASIHGYVDLVDGSRVAGWAWDQGNPINRLKIEIFDGNNQLAVVSANGFRQDLRDAHIGDGVHAFTYSHNLADGKVHMIRVLVAGTNVELTGSPARLGANR